MHEETKRLLQENNALEEQLPPEDRAALPAPRENERKSSWFSV